jgi:hypothetical protein
MSCPLTCQDLAIVGVARAQWGYHDIHVAHHDTNVVVGLKACGPATKAVPNALTFFHHGTDVALSPATRCFGMLAKR